MKNVTPQPHAALVLESIQAAADRYEAAKQERIRVARMGRAAGLTFAQIGEQLGMSDGGVVHMLNRASDAA